MGRKSRKARMIKPFCYFCLREFDNEKILIQHQKAKHFKCSECNRKLETANGLLVHMQQVHKMVQKRVPNSLEGRDDINSTIQGMNGVPVEIIEDHRMQHFQKLNSLKNQKQQRINWAQIQMPNNVNFNINNNFATPQNSTQQGLSQGLNTLNSAQYGAKDNTANQDKAESLNLGPPVGGNKLLILDPYGLPIQQEKEQKPVSNIGFHSQPLSFGVNSAKSTGFSLNLSMGLEKKSSGFSDGPPTYHSTQHSQPNSHTVNQVHNTNSVHNTQPSSDTVNSGELGNVVDSVKEEESVLYYKVTGVEPVNLPLPTLVNTKLSYSSDNVSIEELRAKYRYNLAET